MSEETTEEVSTDVDTSVENASPEPEADAKSQESEAESTPAVSKDEEKPGSFGDRIKQLTDKRRSDKQTSDAKLHELRAENDRLTEELKGRPRVQEPLKTIEDFDHDDGKYQEYLDQRTERIAESAASEAVSKVQTQLESGQIDQSFQSKESTFESTVDDYVDSVYGLDANGQRKWAASDAMTTEIRMGELGPEVAYHLSKNPELASEIAALSPRETVKRMTLLESDLKSEIGKSSKSVSDAPPPPPKLPAGDTGLEKGYNKDMSDNEFNKMRRKEIANR